MINRELYMNKLLAYKDTEFIKVITGIRRCGKSSLLKLLMEKIQEDNKKANVIYMNFESFAFDDILNYKDMYQTIKEQIDLKEKNYILLDEVQRVEEWEKCVNALMVDFNSDIYITGSNAYLLSSELSTFLSGRYIEIKMLPLSFKEFLDFSPFEVGTSLEEKFDNYIKFGGMPGIITLKNDENLYENAIKGIYNTVFMKDVMERNKLVDATILEKILKFLMSNIGSLISSKKIADFLTSQGTKITHNTVLNYLEMLGYEITIGKTDTLEVDFVATNAKDRKYYQVTYSLLDETVKAREFMSLKNISDNYEKTIITMDKLYSNTSEDGIKVKYLIDFLLEG